MRDLKGTKTEKNLWEAFAGESQARNKYDYYAAQAKKDGYVQIKNIFEETARNEKEHAKLWFKYLMGGKIPDTATNLKDAAAGENYEHTIMYARMRDEAREEGFDDIADRFEHVRQIEERHETRYLKLLANVENDRVFKAEESILWKCDNCGFIYEGVEAPQICPACLHPRAHFERFVEAY